MASTQEFDTSAVDMSTCRPSGACLSRCIYGNDNDHDLISLDVASQVDVSAAGSLGRHDFSLALDRAGVKLPAEDQEKLFRSLSSARTAGVGCDIEMFAHLVNFWAR